MASKTYVSKKNYRQVCPRCHERNMARVARQGFFQNSIFPMFGLYPWECSKCRIVKLLRNRGVQARSQRREEASDQA